MALIFRLGVSALKITAEISFGSWERPHFGQSPDRLAAESFVEKPERHVGRSRYRFDERLAGGFGLPSAAFVAADLFVAAPDFVAEL
jgi:hypothetical protein